MSKANKLFATFFVLSILVLSGESFAQSKINPAAIKNEQSIEKLSHDINSDSEINKLKESLDDAKMQITELNNSIIEDKKSVYDSAISTASYIVGVISALATIISLGFAALGIWGWQSFKDLKNNIKNEVSKGLNSDIQGLIDKTIHSTYGDDLRKLQKDINDIKIESQQTKKINDDGWENAFDE